jgi:hypothetical protein
MPFKGSLDNTNVNAPVVGMASTPDGQGYWLVGSDGGVFAFGDAHFFGSIGNTPLNAPVVAMASTPDGQGYWLVASDGGVFAYGDARFFGSIGSTALSEPVVGMASTPDGQGYWLVASDGGVFAYGDAHFYGSTGNKALNAPVVGMASSPDGQGYRLVASDGGVFAYGDARFVGSIGSTALSAPVVGMASTPAGQGYWLVASDGGVFAYGDAPFRGSASGHMSRSQSITSLVSGPGIANDINATGDFSAAPPPAGAPYAQGDAGFDISYPQCGKAFPPRSNVGVVGVNDGSAFTINPCFAREASWAAPNLTVYVNLNAPPSADSTDWDHGPDGTCPTGSSSCESYNYGFNAVQNSVAYVRSTGNISKTWWLDIETRNNWSSNTAANDHVIAGALASIRLNGDTAAIYSTNYQWNRIAGNYVPGVPAWYATGVVTDTPKRWCSGTSFAGGPIYLVQGGSDSFDGDYSC